MYLWRETGPVAWYVDHGYAFLHMDVRGTGRSGGEYRFLDEVEQRDLYDAIEWIATQPWSDGNVGGIGQSYYAVMQWFMAIQNPPHLRCIAPYDGLIDVYRASAFSGGIPGEFFNLWYNQLLRPINQYPAHGPSRELPWDMPYVARQHPTYDAFWKERAAAEQLDKIKVPVYSIGLWTKVDLHLNGNIVGYQRIAAPKKLLLLGTSNLFAAVSDFSSVAFHEKFLLPFYDHYLKGRQTPYLKEPNVRYFVGGADEFKTAETWPPAHIRLPSVLSEAGALGQHCVAQRWRLGHRRSGSGQRAHPVRLSEPRLAGWRGRLRRRWPAGPVTTGADLHYRTAGGGYRDRGADQARSLRRFHQPRHRLRGQALRPGAAVAGTSDEGHSTGISGGDQGLAAGVAPCCGPEAVDRIRALVHTHRSSAP